MIEGILDVSLHHRDTLAMLMRDAAFLAEPSVFCRYSTVLTTTVALVAGAAPDLAAQVRASQAVAALTDPIVMHGDVPPVVLRREVLRGVDLLLTEPRH